MERAAHHPIGDGPPCYIDQNWRGKNGEQCKLEDFQAVLDKDNDAYGRCKRNALGKAVVDNLEALQYFSKGYPREKVTYTDPESSSKRTGVCEWPCANHFKLHPAVTGQNVPVRLRVGNAPRTDLGMRRDGYVLENPVTGTMVGCEYATSTGNKDYLNYGSFGELEWFVEGSERRVVGSFLDFWPGGSQELWNFNKSDNERRCSCIWGKLAADGPARQCKTGKGLACRPEDVRFRMYDLSVHAPADRDRSDRTIMITEIGDVIT